MYYHLYPSQYPGLEIGHAAWPAMWLPKLMYLILAHGPVMACVPQLILNASQGLPRSVLLSRECLCQGQFDHAVVPKRHPYAQCLRKAKQLETVDAQQSLVNFQGSHVRRELVALMTRCRQRRRRLFYMLQLRGVANEMRIEQVQKAVLVCAPKACDEEATRAWLSAALIISSQLGHLEPAPCRGDGDLLLPPRLGLPSELDQGLHSYITSNGGNLNLSFVVSEGLRFTPTWSCASQDRPKGPKGPNGIAAWPCASRAPGALPHGVWDPAASAAVEGLGLRSQ